MLNLNENALENRRLVNRLVELVDIGFDDTDYVWHQFFDSWKKTFVIDNTHNAKRDPTWIPTDKQANIISSVIAKLEFHLEEIREYYS